MSPKTPPCFFFHDERATYTSHRVTPRFLLHDGQATYPSHPSHLLVSSSTTGGRLTRVTRDTRVTPNGGCLPYPCPHSITETCACHVCLPKSGRIYARTSFATSSTTSHFFLDHRMLTSECPSLNECQMLQCLSIFIRVVGRVVAQAD